MSTAWRTTGQFLWKPLAPWHTLQGEWESWSSFVQVMASCLISTESLAEPMMTRHQYFEVILKWNFSQYAFQWENATASIVFRMADNLLKFEWDLSTHCGLVMPANRSGSTLVQKSPVKSPRSGVTLCFQFVSALSAASTAATTFASHV